MDDQQFHVALAESLRAMGGQQMRLQIELPLCDVLQLVGMVQCGAQHPLTPDQTLDVVARFISSVTHQMRESGMDLAATIIESDNPAVISRRSA